MGGTIAIQEINTRPAVSRVLDTFNLKLIEYAQPVMTTCAIEEISIAHAYILS